MRIIEIDCATLDAKIGVALGRLDGARLEIQDATLCSRERSAASVIGEWVTAREGATLLALDAPLGWPSALGDTLGHHRAGWGIDVPANSLFRRETDCFIHRTLKRKPLDVGAERIARTAHSALRMLSELRKALNAPVPLAWTPRLGAGVSAIEVYPAATLVAHGIRSKGYKKPSQSAARGEIVKALRKHLGFDNSLRKLNQSADLIDATVCVLAGADFLRGQAMGPEDRGLAEREGWIWSLPPRTVGAPRSSQHRG